MQARHAASLLFVWFGFSFVWLIFVVRLVVVVLVVIVAVVVVVIVYFFGNSEESGRNSKLKPRKNQK